MFTFWANTMRHKDISESEPTAVLHLMFLTSTMLRRSLTYIRSVSIISITTRSTYVSWGFGAIVTVANGDGGSGVETDGSSTGQSNPSSCGEPEGASGGLSSRWISAPADGAGAEPLLPSLDDSDETVDTVLTGRPSSKGSVLDREQQSAARGSGLPTDEPVDRRWHSAGDKQNTIVPCWKHYFILGWIIITKNEFFFFINFKFARAGGYDQRSVSLYF